MKDQQEHVLLKELPALRDEVPPMPEGFHEGWLQLVREDAAMMEEKQSTRQQGRTGRFAGLKRLAAVAAAVVFVVGGTALTRDYLPGKTGSTAAAGGMTRMAYEADYDGGYIGDYNATYDSYGYGGAGGSGLMMAKAAGGEVNTLSAMDEGAVDTQAQESKIIRTASLTIATKTYDESLALLRQLCGDAGGWVSWSSESTGSTGLRSASLTLRIPAAQLDAFLEGTGGAGRVTYRSETADDVSDSYYDTAARLETQKALMARLRALVTDAASLSDLLELESQIADTQYQIDRLTASLQSTDRQVDYATVDISLREERAADDITNPEMGFGERLLSALRAGWESFVSFVSDMAVFLVAALPFLAVVAAVVIGWRVWRRRRRG